MRALVLGVLLLVAPHAQERPLPDFHTFAAEVKKHLATDEERQSGYVFNERRVEQKVNAAGRVTGESVKIYEVYPGLPDEDRYRRLIEEDGRATPPDRLAKQDSERRKKAEEYARKQAVASERQKDAREQDKARQEYSAAVEDIFRIYDIRMLRREPIDGIDTILATLTPKPGARPQTDDGKGDAAFQGPRLDQRVRLRTGAGGDRGHRQSVLRSRPAGARAQGDGRDLRASQGQW